jgi:hypothetical protein
MGEWLGINGEAIYNSSPWATQNDTSTEGTWCVGKYFKYLKIFTNYYNNLSLYYKVYIKLRW